MISVAKCAVLTCLILTGLILPVHAGNIASHQDIVSSILNAIVTEGADKSIVDQVHRDDDFARDFVDFLNRDFSTNAFGRHAEITCADVQYQIDGVGNHFGFTVVEFADPKDLDRAFKAAFSASRHNFKVEVLTVFRIFRANRNFIILYSESPRSGHTIRIFNSLALLFTKTDGR